MRTTNNKSGMTLPQSICVITAKKEALLSSEETLKLDLSSTIAIHRCCTVATSFALSRQCLTFSSLCQFLSSYVIRWLLTCSQRSTGDGKAPEETGSTVRPFDRVSNTHDLSWIVFSTNSGVTLEGSTAPYWTACRRPSATRGWNPKLVLQYCVVKVNSEKYIFSLVVKKSRRTIPVPTGKASASAVATSTCLSKLGGRANSEHIAFDVMRKLSS